MQIEVPGAAPSGRDAIETDIVSDNILLIKISRPHRRNAFDGPTSLALEAIIDDYEANSTLRCAILSGTSESFCAGQDLIAAKYGDLGFGEHRGGFGILKVPPTKPIIAAVEGAAVGGGLELCLACDMVLASSASVFGLPEVSRSMLAMGGGLLRLHKRIPHHVAMEMILTGKYFSAERMAALGLVNRVTEVGGALGEAVRLAQDVVKNAPLAVQASKTIVVGMDVWTEEEGWEKQMAYVDQVSDSEDFQEGLASFAEKRLPVWKGV